MEVWAQGTDVCGMLGYVEMDVDGTGTAREGTEACAVAVLETTSLKGWVSGRDGTVTIPLFQFPPTAHWKGCDLVAQRGSTGRSP